MPYFSIIMPTKNREKIISQPIKSIINQTFQDWELIVIDDHGIDNTKEIMENFKDQRIKYYYLDSDHGPGAARDVGIRKASANTIALADSDDINYSNRLELTYNVFQENQDVDIVYGLANRLETDGTETLRPSHPFNANLLRCYNFIPQVTVAFKKSAHLSTAGYDPKLRTSEDYDIWLTFLEKNFKFYFINQPLVLQKIHEDSTLLKLALEQRKKNLAYVRKKHKIKTPKFEDVKALVQNKELLDFISTPGAIDFWFKEI